MSRKTMIIIGMIVGSTAGGALATTLGAGGLSLTSVLGKGFGAILGIWLAFKLTD